MGPCAFSVLRLLGNGQFHTISNLAQTLNVSHRQISSAIDDIEQYGIFLKKTQTLGIRSHHSINWLDGKEITNYLCQATSPFQFIMLDVIDSTNRFLLDLELADSVHRNLVVIAELQTRGRGRHGRRWHSSLGDSLTFSLLWNFDRPVRLLSGLSLAIGVAIIRALSNIGIEGLMLKWPNDILYDFRKLAGILIELSHDKQCGSSVVIGIGLNVKLSSLENNKIERPFVDLFAITGRILNRNRLLAVLLSELASVLEDYNEFGFGIFRDEWIRYHAYEGKLITICLPDGSFVNGVADGVELDGSIQLNLESGEKVSHSSGELALPENK